MTQRFIPTTPDDAEILTNIIKNSLIDHFDKDKIPERTTLKIVLTATDIRQAYAEGKIPSSFVKDYDLFNKKKTTVFFRMHGLEIENIIVEDVY